MMQIQDTLAPTAGQRWNAVTYAENARFNVDLADAILGVLAPLSGERILDLGCGDGALTSQLVARGCDVVGVDASPELVAAARDAGVNAVLGDAQALDFDAEFDAVFSNAALHWMLQVDATLAGVFRALKPGGRLVAEFGGHACVAAIRTALHGAVSDLGFDAASLEPWYFPTPEEYRTRLESAGFEVRHIELVPRPTHLPTGVRGWLETFSERFLAPLSPDERERSLQRVELRLKPILCDASGNWTADYTRLRVAAVKPTG